MQCGTQSQLRCCETAGNGLLRPFAVLQTSPILRVAVQICRAQLVAVITTRWSDYGSKLCPQLNFLKVVVSQRGRSTDILNWIDTNSIVVTFLSFTPSPSKHRPLSIIIWLLMSMWLIQQRLGFEHTVFQGGFNAINQPYTHNAANIHDDAFHRKPSECVLTYYLLSLKRQSQ